MRTRTFVAAGLLVTLLVAGVVSLFASGAPDGLERVAEDAGFADTAEEHPGEDGPLADYSTRGVEDDRLSGAVAGVVGSAVVLLVAGGLVYLVRRRSAADDASPAGAERGVDPEQRGRAGKRG